MKVSEGECAEFRETVVDFCQETYRSRGFLSLLNAQCSIVTRVDESRKHECGLRTQTFFIFMCAHMSLIFGMPHAPMLFT